MVSNFYTVELTINKYEIISYFDLLVGAELVGFHLKLAKDNLAKVFILKSADEFLYVGSTVQSLHAHFSRGTISQLSSLLEESGQNTCKVQLFA
jgi:hypothetical protein